MEHRGIVRKLERLATEIKNKKTLPVILTAHKAPPSEGKQFYAHGANGEVIVATKRKEVKKLLKQSFQFQKHDNVIILYLGYTTKQLIEKGDTHLI